MGYFDEKMGGIVIERYNGTDEIVSTKGDNQIIWKQI